MVPNTTYHDTMTLRLRVLYLFELLVLFICIFRSSTFRKRIIIDDVGDHQLHLHNRALRKRRAATIPTSTNMEEEQLFTTVTIINDIDIDKNDKNEILLNTECTAIILER